MWQIEEENPMVGGQVLADFRNEPFDLRVEGKMARLLHPEAGEESTLKDQWVLEGVIKEGESLLLVARSEPKKGVGLLKYATLLVDERRVTRLQVIVLHRRSQRRSLDELRRKAFGVKVPRVPEGIIELVIAGLSPSIYSRSEREEIAQLLLERLKEEDLQESRLLEEVVLLAAQAAKVGRLMEDHHPAVEWLVRDGHTSHGRAAELLDVSVSELRELYPNWTPRAPFAVWDEFMKKMEE